MLAVVNGMLYASGRVRLCLVNHEENAIPNVLFAPALLTLFLAITLVVLVGS